MTIREAKAFSSIIEAELKAKDEKIKELKFLIKECILHLIAGGYFTIEEVEQALKGE